MKTAFSLVLTEKDYQTILLELAEAGFDGVEPTFHPSGLPSPENWEVQAKQFAQAASRVGLAVPSMRGGPLFWSNFGSGKAEERALVVDLARRALSALRIMGGEVLLIVPGRWDAGNSYLEQWRRCLDTAKQIAEVADTQNRTVGLENVENKFLLSPREWCEFLDSVESPRLRSYFDIGNVFIQDLGQPEDWIRDLDGRIVRVHVKDCRRQKQGGIESREIAPLLQGDVPWPAVASALRHIDYDSWLTAELPVPESGRREFFRTTREAIVRIWKLDPLKS